MRGEDTGHRVAPKVGDTDKYRESWLPRAERLIGETHRETYSRKESQAGKTRTVTDKWLEAGRGQL